MRTTTKLSVLIPSSAVRGSCASPVVRNRSGLAFLLAASVSLAGCATKLQVPPSARTSLDIVGPVPAGSLPTTARIVPDEHPIELPGEFTAEGRAAIEEARSARIANRPRARMNAMSDAQVGAQIAACVISVVGIVACPLGLAIGSAVHGTINGVRYIKASAREASMLIPEKHAYRLAAMFKEHATGRALGERASRFTMPQQSTNGTDAEPRLVVRMKAVETLEVRRNWLGIRIIAEAQAFPSPGVALTPTQHVYAWSYGPLSEWTEDNDELVKHTLGQALDALAESIAATYMRTRKLSEVAAQKTAGDQMATESGIALSAVEPSWRMLPSPLPAAGDTWTYRLTAQRGRQGLIHQVTITSVTPDAIFEQLSIGQKLSMQTEHRRGGYLMRQGDISLFSPYFVAFDSLESPAPMFRIENLDPKTCGPRACSVTGRVLGRELVRVPAGEFQSIKVEIEQGWVGMDIGGRTLTVWYAPEIKRAVKFSSQGSYNRHTESEFDLELESYKLN